MSDSASNITIHSEQTFDKFEVVCVTPKDILDGVRTFSPGSGFYCHSLDGDWTSSDEYLAWAKKGLDEGGQKGRSDTVTYAKRAVCRTIDSILLRHHMRVLLQKSYPERMDALVQIGLSVPDIVHDLVIDPRNQIEHEYRLPTVDQARHAIELAELFLTSIEQEIALYPPVLLWPGLNYQSTSSENKGHRFEITRFGSHPLLFVDLFQNPHCVKIVDPGYQEIRWTSLTDFTVSESIALGKFVHAKQSGMGCDCKFFELFKETLGI